jgi:hypothetical protein
MTELGLNPSELIAFAVIHHYTAYQGGYAGGALALSKWCGIAKSKIYRVLDKLIEKEYVVKLKTSKGRGTTVYASIINCPQTGQLEDAKGDSYLSRKGTVNCPETGHYIDNRYIDTPYSPPKGDSANAGAKSGASERKRRRPRRATNIISSGDDYSDERLAEMGITMGKEFYDSLDELRID